jgi:chloramphenicol 3-O phosphotransferase
MTKPQIIILNGIGSVGKSSTAKALQKITSEHFLHVPGDSFLDMMPEKLWNHADGISFQQSEGSDVPSVTIEMGEAALRVFSGMRAAVAALARQGNHLIVDDVMLSANDQQEYRSFLTGLEFRFVGLFAPLDILEERERARRDRLLGLARWQYDRVHTGISYDLEVHTSEKSPNDCARIIATTFGLIS